MTSEKPPVKISIPGQALDDAAAEVASEAGKSLIRGIGRLANAQVDQWVKSKEAKAAAAALAINTQSEIEATQSKMSARRDFELQEQEHMALLERRAQRLRAELEREQINLEAIETKALEYANKNEGPAQELEEDWLFRFSTFAQTVSDEVVQDIWARVLASSASSDNRPLSPTALQTLSFMDRDAAESFRRFVFVVHSISIYPQSKQTKVAKWPISGIDFRSLLDLGLIQETVRDTPYRGPGFDVYLGNSKLPQALTPIHVGHALTVRGQEIAKRVFKAADVELDSKVAEGCWNYILEFELETSHALTLSFAERDFLLNGRKEDGTVSPITDLENLAVHSVGFAVLKWASTHFYVTEIESVVKE